MDISRIRSFRRGLRLGLLYVLLSPTLAFGVTASDDFNRTENPLASGWSTFFGFTAMEANGTEARGTSAASDNGAVYTGVAFSGDHYSQGVVGTASSVNLGLIVRGSSGASQGYVLFWTDASATWTVFEIGGAEMASGTFTEGAVVAGDTIRLEIKTEGATAVLRVFQNGVEQTAATGSLTDSSSPDTGGSPGIYSEGTTTGFTSWEGGDLDSGGYILTEAGDCLNAENADRLITEDVAVGVGPCDVVAAVEELRARTLMGVGL